MIFVSKEYVFRIYLSESYNLNDLENGLCGNGVYKGGSRVVCNDNEFCNDDSCDPETECVFKNVVKLCDDGNKCTTEDSCRDGTCTGGQH